MLVFVVLFVSNYVSWGLVKNIFVSSSNEFRINPSCSTQHKRCLLSRTRVLTPVLFESRSGGEYSILHYVIKFVSDCAAGRCFLQVLRFPPPIKLTATIFTEILLKVFFEDVFELILPSRPLIK